MQENKTMTIYAAKVRGNEANCRYPTRIDLVDEEAAIKAFSYDTVFAEYRNNYRSKDNFIRSNTIPFDCDNDNSDTPCEWITEDDIAAFFSEVTYIIHYSRNHMKQKGERSARPRFHILFLIDEIFRGTNSDDRTEGALTVLKKLSKPFICGLMTTHDYAMIDKTEKGFDNIRYYHFSESYTETGIAFDYKLTAGISRQSNAKYLMKLVGIG